MSYNITSMKIKKGSFAMTAGDVTYLRRKFKGQLPEICFLREIEIDRIYSQDDIKRIDDNKFWWTGCGSGTSFHDVFLHHVVPLLFGHATLLIVWEGGDTVQILEIENGEVIKDVNV